MRSARFLLLLPLLAHLPRPAEACSPPPPGFQDSRPISGDTVPANAVLYARAFGIFEPQASILDFDFFVSLPVDTYGGLLRVPLQPEGFVITGPTQVILSSSDDFTEPLNLDLTISDVADTEAPVLEGDLQISFEYFPDDEPGLCQGSGYNVRFTFEHGRDNDRVAAYAIYEVFPNDAVELRGARLAYNESKGVAMGVHEGLNEAGEHCYFAVAIDQAGNESPGPRGGITACVNLQPPSGPDAGVVDVGTPDGGTIDQGRPADGGVAEDAQVPGPDMGQTGQPDQGSGELILDDEKGCSCNSQRSQGGRGLSWGLLLGLWLVARRKATTGR